MGSVIFLNQKRKNEFLEPTYRINQNYITMKDNSQGVLLENALREFSSNMLLFNFRNFRYFPFFLRNIWNQRKAMKLREKNSKMGIVVPPVLAFSITNKCNLNCIGCYQKAQQKELKPDFTDQEIVRILNESRDLGSSIVLLLGGEPLMRDVFELTSSFKDMLFALYTNSTLIDDAVIQKLKKNKHLIPILSMEGSETDIRRGYGVMDSIREVSAKMHQQKIKFGLSLTVTRKNIDEVCEDEFVRKMIENGNVFFSYFKYIPIDKKTIDLTLTPEQLVKFEQFTMSFKKKYKYKTLLMTPENEKKYGGCFGAGKGVVHINSEGAIETCPFAPYSDVSIKDMSLKESLKSPLFMNLRKHHDKMIEDGLQMCTLWEDEKWENAAKTNDFSFLEN